MFLGIDIGTSAVKAVLLEDDGQVAGGASSPLAVSRPQPLWSEQEPEQWWQATIAAVSQLPVGLRAAVKAVGLSGQMHGATVLDAAGMALRPAILWNDGRAFAECAELEATEPRSRQITGNIAMPGFTAPKLLWLRRHEPGVFRRIARVLLPKDYVRLRLTGEYLSDLSDSSGTLWLDVGARCWSEAMLAACGLALLHMPGLVEGSDQAGQLRAGAAAELGVPVVPVAGGGGDNAAGAVGAGVVAHRGQRSFPAQSRPRGARVLSRFARTLASDGRAAVGRQLSRLGRPPGRLRQRARRARSRRAALRDRERTVVSALPVRGAHAAQ
jgi:xylulokinase